MYNYGCLIQRVVDGDTAIGIVDLGFGVSHKLRLRLVGINAPELKTEAGKVSYEALKAKIEGTTVMIDTVKDRQEKWGRYLAIITTTEGLVINDWLIQGGYAVKWTTI